MLLRIVLFLGFALVLAAGGAAGWQYWQSLPQQAAAAETAPSEPAASGPVLAVQGEAAKMDAPSQTWMISPGGGLVPRDTARNWLKQDSFVKDRTVSMTLTAPLTDLLEAGEVLPGQPYRQVFADIRAKALAQDLCRPLLADIAASCAVVSARAPEGSLDPTGEFAAFNIQLAYTLKPDAAPLPDLGAHVLMTNWASLETGAVVPAEDTPAAYLAAVASATRTACPQGAASCRPMHIMVSWQAGGQATALITAGWLAPLPKGMYPAPPLF